MQCMQYLFVKLKPNLSIAIIIYYKVLEAKNKLILLVIRLEIANKGLKIAQASYKHNANKF